MTTWSVTGRVNAPEASASRAFTTASTTSAVMNGTSATPARASVASTTCSTAPPVISPSMPPSAVTAAR